MVQQTDILIVGAGPAGISAALTAKARGRSVAVLSADPLRSPLAKAPRIENYPGVGPVSGRELLTRMMADLQGQAIPVSTGPVSSAVCLEGKILLGQQQEMFEATSLILATGARQGSKPLPGEEEFLGRGVSYCATCDGMLYRGRTVAVLGFSAEAEKEADFLRDIGCRVLYFDREQARTAEITGASSVTGVVCGGQRREVSAVFVLRDTVSARTLLPQLAMEDGHIRTGPDMATSLPGVFAAGDCTGRPYQVARAAGQGNLAALSADRYCRDRAAGATKAP